MFNKQSDITDSSRALEAWNRYQFPKVDSNNQALVDQITYLAKNKILRKLAFYANTDKNCGIVSKHQIILKNETILLPCGEQFMDVRELQSSSLRFTYSDQGLTFGRDELNYEQVPKIYTLKQEKVQNLLKKAQLYKGTTDPEKTSIFQITTRVKKSRHETTLFNRGIKQLELTHFSCRVIQDNGDVFAFGKHNLPGEIQDERFFLSKGGGIAAPDFEEESEDPKTERLIVSIPVTQSVAQELLQGLGKEWFNMLNQNCVRFAHGKLQIADPDLHLDVKFYPHQLIASLTPFFDEEAELKRRMEPPAPLTLWGRVSQILLFLPKILLSAIVHLIAIQFLGGWSTKTNQAEAAKWTNNKTALGANPFDYDNLCGYSNKYLINWMLKQKSLERFEQAAGNPHLAI